MKVTRLDGPLLDYWVAKSEGLELLPDAPAESEGHIHGSGFWHPSVYQPSSNWAQGGPIVSNEWYDLENVLNEWFGPNWPFIKAIGDEPLKWMMRAFVTTRFGEEVEEVAGIASAPPAAPPISKPEFQPAASSRKWPAWFDLGRTGKIDTSC